MIIKRDRHVGLRAEVDFAAPKRGRARACCRNAPDRRIHLDLHRSRTTGSSWLRNPHAPTSWPVLISDKPSDNGHRQRQTERDALRHRNLSDLRQSDPARWLRTQPSGMVRRRSTVRFRNGAPGKDSFSNTSDNQRGTGGERRSSALIAPIAPQGPGGSYSGQPPGSFHDVPDTAAPAGKRNR